VGIREAASTSGRVTNVEDLVEAQSLVYMEEVYVQSRDEQWDEAVAHVVFVGRAAPRARRFKDGVSLRRSANRWEVVLPQEFGRMHN
jgi:hypothetical protein